MTLTSLYRTIPPMTACQILNTVVAMAIAQIVAVVFHVTQGFWIPLTTLVVCLTITSSSAAFRRAFQRVYGTIFGIIIGSIAVMYITHPAIFLILLIVAGALAYWSKCFDRHYAVFVCLITAVVAMLLAAFFNQTPHELWMLLIYRIIDIAIGALIAYACSLVIMLLNHHNQVYNALVSLLGHMVDVNLMSLRAVTGNGQEHAGFFPHHFRTLKEYSRGIMPVCSYDLLLNRYILSQVKLFIHRINKILMTLNLLNSVTGGSRLSPETLLYQALERNGALLESAAQHMEQRDLYGTRECVDAMRAVNREIRHLALEEQDTQRSQLLQMSVILTEVGNDFFVLLNGIALFFLTEKARKDRETSAAHRWCRRFRRNAHVPGETSK